MSTRFRDVQRFRQKWLWLILAPAIIAAWWGFVQQVLIGIPFGDNPAPDVAVWIIWLLVGIGVPVLFWKVRLEIRLFEDRLEYEWFPVIRRSVSLDDIASAEARTYRPVLEYGGWGLRYGGKERGWAYSTDGNTGVFVTCKDGKCFLLGTDRAEELEAALNELLA